MEKDFRKQIDDIEESMYSYARECKSDGDDCGYSPRHIRKCKKILQTYLNPLGKMTAPTDGAIMTEVEKTVLALNRLNKRRIMRSSKRTRGRRLPSLSKLSR